MTDTGQEQEREGVVLKPCPFCGGEAERVDIEDGENVGGSCICCRSCQASSNVEFEFKENFVSNWNRRVCLIPPPSEQAADARIAALEAENARQREGLLDATRTMWNALGGIETGQTDGAKRLLEEGFRAARAILGEKP